MWIDPARPSPIHTDSALYHKILASDEWIAEFKHDGVRCLVINDGKTADWIKCKE